MIKQNKGITLVALVITIILLLILAGITIATLTESGLFENARLAEEKYKEAQEKEQEELAKYMNAINSEGASVKLPEDEPDIETNPIEEGMIMYSTFDSETVQYSYVDYTIQGNSNIQISDYSKIGSGSCYFPGTDSQRLTQTVSDLNFGTNDFTVEFWSYAETQTMPYALFFGSDSNANLNLFIQDGVLSSNISLVIGNTRIIDTNKKYTENQWMHYAVVRKDGIFYVYENGIKIGETDQYTTSGIVMTDLAIGGNSSTSNTGYKGYIDDFVIYDYAKYENTFTPSENAKTDENILYSSFDEKISAKLTKIGIQDLVTEQLYNNIANTNVYITDEKYKAGGKSIYFTGETAQRLNQTVSELNFGTNDFTIEFWSYAETQTMPHALFFGSDSNANLNFFIQDGQASNNMSLAIGITRIIDTNKKYTENQWMHYAVVRKDGVFYIYENGIKIGETDQYTTSSIVMTDFSIGGNASTDNTAYKGYLDELKIYNYAKYTNDFEIGD